MKPGALAIFLMIATFLACGGCSSPSPTAPSNPTSPRGTWVDAPPTTIGAVEGNSYVGNVLPFGGTVTAGAPGTTYQQIYLGNLFGSGQVRLTAVEFFAGPANGSREVVSANYTFSMSTTTKAVEALDTANLVSNIGANQQIVFSAALGPGAIVDSRLRIGFSNPFSFTPGSGNLLLQIARSNPGPNTSAAFLAQVPNDGFPTGLSSRAHDFSSNVGPGIYLVSRFHQQRCQCPTDAPCTC